MAIDLDKTQKDISGIKEKIKKRFPLVFLFLLLLWTISVFYFGNFLDESYIVKSTNIFNMLFGKTVVEITEYYNPQVDNEGSRIYFDITNIGDKDTENLQVLYSFCGLEQEKVELEKLKLRVDKSEKFSIFVPIRLNSNCSVFTDKVQADVYEDNKRNCYLDIENKFSNVCKYCKVVFEVYGNNNKIGDYTLWYPYLDAPTNVGKMARYLLVNYPMKLTWKDGHESVCKVLHENSGKTGLKKTEPIYTTLFDTSTMCLRGDDIEWCKDNYYTT